LILAENAVPAGTRFVTNWTGLTPVELMFFNVRDATMCDVKALINVNDLIIEPLGYHN